MKHKALPLLLLMVWLAGAGSILSAQTQERLKPPVKPAEPLPSTQIALPSTDKSAGKVPAGKAPDDAAPLRALLTQRAIAELELVAGELKEPDDLANSLPLVRTLVKKLAAHRPERCRELLNALFDKAERQATRDEAKLKEGGAFSYAANFKAIIGIAASFDATFARKLLERFQESQPLAPVMDKSESGFFLAKTLLESDPQQAIAIANRLAGEAYTARTLEFIGALRKQDPKLAQVYLNHLLRQLETRKYPALNELLLLYPYVFLVAKFPVYVPSAGRLAFLQNIDYGKDLSGLTVDTGLAKQYLQLGLKLLLEQERYLDGKAWEKADPRGDLAWLDLVLLPSASEYLPEAVEPLLQRRGALLGFLEPAAQESVANSVNSFNTAKRNLPDEGDPLKQAGETKDPERRDQLYFLAAQRAVKAGDFENAFAHTEKMSSRNSRPAHEQIIFQIAQQELQAGNVEDARRRIAAEADLAWRAYLLTRMGVFYLEGKAKDVQRAEEVLNEVATLAGKLDTGVEKALVLAGAAAVYARFDQVRALEVFREFVTAANKAEKFDGRNFLMRSLPLNKFYYGSYLYQDFTFTEIFTRLARGYFDTLLVEARTLNHPMARAKAIITLCDAVL